jgi:D-3-phosphoglycerate dehydrogenase
MSSSRPVIVVPGDEPLQIGESPHLERLRANCDVRVFRDRPLTDAEKVRRALDADVIINSRGYLKWTAEILQQLPKLRLVSLCGIGTDSVDLETARAQGILVANIPGKTAPLVAEHAFALLLATARRLAYQTAELKAGRWTRREAVFVRGKTLGVVGTGSIGQEMIRIAKAFGMVVRAWSFHPRPELAASLGFSYVSLDELLATSDAISIHVKLTAESRHLVGARELSRMRPGSLLINTARGAIVDPPALVAALQSGHLGGAGLDVYEVEPLPADDPLLACEQVVLTPHNADQTPEGMEILNAGAVDNVIAFLAGNPQNIVP